MALTSTLSKSSFSLGFIENKRQLEQLWQLDAEAYGDSNLEFDRFERWWQAYDRGITAVFYEQEIVAAFGLWGLSEKQTRSFVGGNCLEKDLQPLTCRYPTPFWYWSGIVTKPEFRQQLFSPLRLLLGCGVSSWLMSGSLKYCPNLYVYALGMSKEGIGLLDGFQFEKIRESKEMLDDFPLYVEEVNNYDQARSVLNRNRR